MDKLLIRYCNLLEINILDFKGDSRADGLPIYRHIFYYCLKIRFSNIRLWHIAVVMKKKPSGVSYGIGTIANLMTPITKAGCYQNILTSDMQLIKGYVASFLKICEEYKETDIELPQKWLSHPSI